MPFTKPECPTGRANPYTREVSALFSSDHYIHFVFDYYNETHYTDTHLSLLPEPYLWYTLRQEHIDSSVYINLGSSGIRLEAYDSDSAALLRGDKKKLFGKAAGEPERKAAHTTWELKELGTDPQTLLGWLLDRQESRKNKRTALVFTGDALQRVVRDARDKDRHRLFQICSRPSGRNLLLVRIPLRSDQMEQAFLRPESVLRQLCPGVRHALEGPREPLLEALDRHLDRQIFHAYRLTAADMRAILLREALVRGDWTDSLRDLEDQADYLYGVSLSQDHPVTRREVKEELSREGNMDRLRAQVARLRQAYPRRAVLDAVLAETASVGGPAPLEWDAELAQSIRTLALPEEFLREHPRWRTEFSAIRRDFCTVWNHPRNADVRSWSIRFANELRSAAQRQDWQTLADCLSLLQFCGRELCADPALKEGIDAIGEEGMTVLKLSYNHFLDRPRLEQEWSGQPDNVFAGKIQQMQDATQKVLQAKYDADGAKLQMLRTTLESAMADFRKRHVSKDVVARFVQEAALRMEQDVGAINVPTPSRSEQPADPAAPILTDEPENYTQAEVKQMGEEAIDALISRLNL